MKNSGNHKLIIWTKWFHEFLEQSNLVDWPERPKKNIWNWIFHSFLRGMSKRKDVDYDFSPRPILSSRKDNDSVPRPSSSMPPTPFQSAVHFQQLHQPNAKKVASRINDANLGLLTVLNPQTQMFALWILDSLSGLWELEPTLALYPDYDNANKVLNQSFWSAAT